MFTSFILPTMVPLSEFLKEMKDVKNAPDDIRINF